MRILRPAFSFFLLFILPLSPSAGCRAPGAGSVGTLTIIAPAAPGGGWDQTARALQHALQVSGIAPVVQVENVPGAAGTIGLAQFVSSERGNGRALFVTGLVMLSAIKTNGSPVTLAQVTPIARLTGEYEVIVVPAGSPFRSMADLIDALKRHPGAISWGGGSAGGTDHMLAGMIAANAGVPPDRVNYVAFSGGGEALAALLGSQVSVGISGVGEFGPHIASDSLRALGISSATRPPAGDIPTLREQGIDIVLANWRGIVAPPGLSEGQRRSLTDTIDRVVRGDAWRALLRAKDWTDLYLAGAPFEQFLRDEDVRVAAIVQALGAARSAAPVAAPGSEVFPFVILTGAGVLAAALAGGALKRRRRLSPVEALAPARSNRRALFSVTAALILHMLLIDVAGFPIAATVLFVLVARGFGSTRPVRDTAIAVVFTLSVYVAFTNGLGLTLPGGPFDWVR